jgi:hypothetical protein
VKQTAKYSLRDREELLAEWPENPLTRPVVDGEYWPQLMTVEEFCAENPGMATEAREKARALRDDAFSAQVKAGRLALAAASGAAHDEQPQPRNWLADQPLGQQMAPTPY